MNNLQIAVGRIQRGIAFFKAAMRKFLRRICFDGVAGRGKDQAMPLESKTVEELQSNGKGNCISSNHTAVEVITKEPSPAGEYLKEGNGRPGWGGVLGLSPPVLTHASPGPLEPGPRRPRGHMADI